MVVTGLENYTVTYMYDINNRLTREEQVDTHGVVSAFVFTYDRNGNQRTRAEVGAMGLETRVYNAFNQLVQFSDSAGGVTSAYGYRADGLRHTVTVNGIRMYHVWLRNHIVLERNGRREVTELYVRGAGGRLLRSHNHLWFVYNNRGDVAQRVDNVGQVLHTYRFSAFGVEVNPDPSNSNPWRFNGEYHDMHRGGEIYLRARAFSPRLGRFSQPDPYFHPLRGNLQTCGLAVLQSGNLYAFTVNNPVRFNDPSGLVIELVGNSNQRNQILEFLQMFTLDTLHIDSSGFGPWRRHEVGFTAYDGNINIGTQLVRDLINHFRILTIQIHNNGASFMYPIHSTRVRASAEIHLNPNHLHNTLVRDWGTASRNPTRSEVAPIHIVLAHEMIHAHREFNRNTVGGDVAHSFLLPNGQRETLLTPREELHTIGLSHRTNDGSWVTMSIWQLSENAIRWELGLPMRTSFWYPAS